MRRFASLTVVAASLVAFDAGAVDLQSHVAAYDLTLVSARSSSGISGIEGRMVLEWIGSCEGATFNQRMGLRIDRADNQTLVSDLTLTSWESRDGEQMRFGFRDVVNGKVIREFRGQAGADGPEGSGQVDFTIPEGKTEKLPPGILFPTAHMRAIILRAAQGDQIISRKIFELSADNLVYDAVAFVSKTVPAGDASGEHHELLAEQRSWRMTIGFFDVVTKSDTPAYEVGLRIFENGVSTEVQLDYGDFKVDAKLRELTYLSGSGC
jgi:hypothetical protein